MSTCQMTRVTCGECGIEFSLQSSQQETLQRTGKRFYCPNGCSISYGKGDMQRKIDSLNRQLTNARERAEYFRRERESLVWNVVWQLRRCPVGCGWHSRKRINNSLNFSDEFIARVTEDVAQHLVDAHGVELPVEEEDTVIA